MLGRQRPIVPSTKSRLRKPLRCSVIHLAASRTTRAIRNEERFVLLGLSERRRLLVVMFTERGDALHLISARRATRRERRKYEESES